MKTSAISLDSRRPNRLVIVVATLALSTLFAGCGGGPGPAGLVDSGLARETLKTALDGWQSGKPIGELKSASPSIVVQDFDWMGGAKLVSYEVAGDGKNDDANLRIPVKLTLKTAKGEVKKSVSYVVGTSPVLTVFRDFN